jgi:hypothetical protein
MQRSLAEIVGLINLVASFIQQEINRIQQSVSSRGMLRMVPSLDG